MDAKKNAPFEFRVCLAQPEQVADIQELRLDAILNHPVAFTADPDRDQRVNWLERIEDPAGQIFLAYVGDRIIGMTGIFRGRSTKTRHTAIIWGVYVKADYRRAGVAKAFFEAALDWAKANQIILVKLGVATDNLPAYIFYKNAGFVEYGREPKAILVDGVLHDEFLMALDLAE